jgi:hypothetical protein
MLTSSVSARLISSGLLAPSMTMLARLVADGDPPDPRWSAPRAAGAGYDRIADAGRDSIDLPAVAKLVGLAW